MCSLGIPFSANRRPRFPWLHHWKAVHQITSRIIHNGGYKSIHVFKPSWNVFISKFFVTWLLDVVVLCSHSSTIVTSSRVKSDLPYPEPVVFQWQSSGNPVCLELRPQCTLECHWRNASVLPVVFQWVSNGFPVFFQCVPIMQINTGSPLGHYWVLSSASVVPVASQCTCGSNGLPVCSNYAN